MTSWVAVEELNLSFCIGETLLLTICTHDKFLSSNPARSGFFKGKVSSDGHRCIATVALLSVLGSLDPFFFWLADAGGPKFGSSYPALQGDSSLLLVN